MAHVLPSVKLVAFWLLQWLSTVVSFPFVCLRRGYTYLCRATKVVLAELRYTWGDIKAGGRVLLGGVTPSWVIVFFSILFLSITIVGPSPTFTLLIIVLICVGGKYGGRVPHHILAHVDRIRDAWEEGMEDDDCIVAHPKPIKLRRKASNRRRGRPEEDEGGDSSEEEPEVPPEVSMERVAKKCRPSVACKVAVRAIAKVGILKRSEANSMVYQRLCLDVMAEMKMRYHDRLVVLPQAILACLERPEEVEEVMEAVKASCDGRIPPA